MFERFTDRARRVLVLAQDEARDLEHNFLGTEHVLLGLVREGEGVGAKALTELGIDLVAVREKVVGIVKPGAPGTSSGAPPFTPRAKRVLELSLKEALELGHNYIGTEHLLLGLIREGEGVGSQVLIAAGLTPEAVRRKVVDLLKGFGSVGQPAGGGAMGERDTSASPAVHLLRTRAKAAAGLEVLGTHHYLLGILEDLDSLGGKVLTSMGVTAEAVRARAAEIGIAGTTDQPPPPRVDPVTVELSPGVLVTIADPSKAAEVVAKLREHLDPPTEGTAAGN